MSLLPPTTVGKLQTALHTKAKNSPDYRFYALYDKLYRRDILEWALVRCRKNDGAPGVDGQSFADIEAYGEDRWLDELTEELKNETYRPRPVRRVFIPKGDGKLRPLGIPCIKDRVVQMAAVLVLEPIFEADLEPEQHAYRPERSALDAVRQVERLIRSGHTEVVDADLSGYFDSIPHAELMKSVSRRISDGRMLRLIKMWLETPVEETDAKGNRHRTTRNKDQGMGTPQGAPISPLLSNIYMRRFVKGWKAGGHEKRLAAISEDIRTDQRARVFAALGRVQEVDPIGPGLDRDPLDRTGQVEPRSALDVDHLLADAEIDVAEFVDPAGQAVEVVTVPTRTVGQEIVAAAVQIDERQPLAKSRRDRLVSRGGGLSGVTRVGPERVREFDLVAFGRQGLRLDPEAAISSD